MIFFVTQYTIDELLKDRKNTPQSDECKKNFVIFILLPGIPQWSTMIDRFITPPINLKT